MEVEKTTLASNLRFLRKSRNLSQDEMLQHTGFSRTTWSNYENALTEPSVNGLLKISRFFGVSIDDLVVTEMKTPGNLKQGKKSRPVRYTNDQYTLLNDPSVTFHHVVAELKKLRQDVDRIQKSASRKK